ncbi:uncharacterized protein F4807DRAFT_420842 [Annulohypoxylon truncatum]|uniref:uncharacterized protein n=1 Tax=Annulohypoxylon truncatum TaxID=327061 RepID=UPI0020080266|nr:uncharacterized protein F4807DRAFT_420842 [Annulohypoxylon truncatum]KAI1210915.1 hypothetical protein F4807DRAFT_420842 [Annulohypoxylon truncatum]
MSAGKPPKWSENEKVSFLVQAIQALSGSSGFPYDSVNLPGRTKRSMMHAWTAARAQHATFMSHSPSDDDPAVTPSPSRGKGSRKRKSKPEDFAGDDDEDVKPRSKKASFSSTSSKISAGAPDDEIGKVKGEPESSAGESSNKLRNDEA